MPDENNNIEEQKKMQPENIGNGEVDPGTLISSVEPYLGSNNPEKRPLNPELGFTDDMSPELVDSLVDRFLGEGTDPYLPDDEAKKRLDGDGGDKKTDESKPEDKDETGDHVPVDETDASKEEKEYEEKFFGVTGITQEVFGDLKPEYQTKLVDAYEGINQESEATKEVQAKNEELQAQINSYANDAVMLARKKEIDTGQTHTAQNSLQPFTEDEIDQVVDADDRDKAFNDIAKQKMRKALAGERLVLDHKRDEEKLFEDVRDIFDGLGDMDSRLKMGKKWKDLVITDKDYKKAEDIKDTISRYSLNLTQIKAMGKEKVYNLIAMDKGWEKERDKKLIVNERKRLLDKYKKAEPAKMIPHSQGTQNQGNENPKGVDRKGLTDEIASGNLNRYAKLLSKANENMDTDMLEVLNACYDKGMSKSKR